MAGQETPVIRCCTWTKPSADIHTYFNALLVWLPLNRFLSTSRVTALPALEREAPQPKQRIAAAGAVKIQVCTPRKGRYNEVLFKSRVAHVFKVL